METIKEYNSRLEIDKLPAKFMGSFDHDLKLKDRVLQQFDEGMVYLRDHYKYLMKLEFCDKVKLSYRKTLYARFATSVSDYKKDFIKIVNNSGKYLSKTLDK